MSMQLYSQRDSAYSQLKLGASNLTVGADGCFLCSLATLYQHSPVELLKVPGAFLPSGLLIPEVIAAYCGGAVSASDPSMLVSDPNKHWCIGMTNHYASVGYPTHFFLVNEATKQMVDPLCFPALVSGLNYNVVQYRYFTNVVFNGTTILPQVASAMAQISMAWNNLNQAMAVAPASSISQAQYLLHQANTLLRGQ